MILLSFFPSGRTYATLGDGRLISVESPAKMALQLKHMEYIERSFSLQTWESIFPRIKFDKKGCPLVTDRGSRLTFDRVLVSEDEIRSALMLAREKFGEPLTLTGRDPVFRKRMSRLAADMGIRIKNPDT